MSDTTPLLEQQAIHIWQVDLKDYPGDTACLNSQEKQRLANFQHARAAERFCVARSALRYLLGEYLQLAAVDVPLFIDGYGKPYIEDRSLHFNLSHTGDQAMMAFSRCGEVGIDIEQHTPKQNIKAIAKRVFDPQTQQQFADEGYTAAAFLRYWVRFEAKQKCLGQGIFGETDGNINFYDAALQDGSHFCVAWKQTCDNPTLHFFQLTCHSK